MTLSKELTLDAVFQLHGQRLFNNGVKTHEEREVLARKIISEFALADEVFVGRTVREWFALAYGHQYSNPEQQETHRQRLDRDQADIQDEAQGYAELQGSGEDI